MPDTVTLAAKLDKYLQRVELLPYYKFGTQTYGRIGREYKLTMLNRPAMTV